MKRIGVKSKGSSYLQCQYILYGAFWRKILFGRETIKNTSQIIKEAIAFHFLDSNWPHTECAVVDTFRGMKRELYITTENLMFQLMLAQLVKQNIWPKGRILIHYFQIVKTVWTLKWKDCQIKSIMIMLCISLRGIEQIQVFAKPATRGHIWKWQNSS